MQIIETVRNRRRQSIARARLSFNAAKSRPNGRLLKQCRRCLIAHNGVATTTDLKDWAYAGRDHRHWHYWNLKRALLSLTVAPQQSYSGISISSY
jgi:hypothetical protein